MLSGKQRVMKFVVKGDGDAEDVIEQVVEALGGDEQDLSQVIKRVRKIKDLHVERVDDGPSTDILIRGLDADVCQRFKTAAGARGLKYADYLSALLQLHDRARAMDDATMRALLEELGLSTVTV